VDVYGTLGDQMPISHLLTPGEPKSVSGSRRAFMGLGAGALAAGMVGRSAFSARPATASGTLSGRLRTPTTASAGQSPPVPPVLRSRRALQGAPPAQPPALPLSQGATTYDMAQEVAWLDSQHFAVGRWDGSMSIFAFETAQYVGPLMTTVVNSPADEGVQMIMPLPAAAIATSNDDASLSLWASRTGDWADLRLIGTPGYDASLGVATNGALFFAGRPPTLVVGHDSGYITLWSYDPRARTLELIKAVNLQNPTPVNPFNSHVIYGMTPLVVSGPTASVVAGSDDGYVSIVGVPSGNILSQTVFNPLAQRGINSVSALGNKLLVTNCSVGADDYNLWYFSINMSTWGIELIDKANLIIDTQLIQAFNFDTVWGRYTGGPCWFGSTEEGVLWMGTADTAIHVIGYDELNDRAVGAAVAFTGGPGRLAVVMDDLNQFVTGSS